MEERKETNNFIDDIIQADISSQKVKQVYTRFPPEPNGFLHIGHVKSLCLNFGMAEKYKGVCNLRFDDTNPESENEEYVEGIKKNIKWLGFDTGERVFYASNYFEKLYEYATMLIRDEKAYVDDLGAEEFAEKYKGTPTVPGKNSPSRSRSIEENLELFEKMRQGSFPEGSKILRAKIDMTHPNMHMRDPGIYRIKYSHHYNTENKWCIYPLYDYAHCVSDSLEGITHSLCTLEFEVHRPLYEWFLDALKVHKPKQIEFARLNLNYTVMSKRKLLELVEEKKVDGWDDPRIPTICGLRRRGYTPDALRNFAKKIGIAKRENMIDTALLEWCIREDLNKIALRKMGIIHPLKLIITNYDTDVEYVDCVNNPEDPSTGKRKVPFSKNIWIEKNDFMLNPPKEFYRLFPGNEVRLKYAYIIKCEDYKTDSDGNIQEIYGRYEPLSKSGEDKTGKKVKTAISWVSAPHSITAEIRLYDTLFTIENLSDIPDDTNWKEYLNPKSLEIIPHAQLEPSFQNAEPHIHYQLERQGYFILDSKFSSSEKLVFNRTVTLKDEWAKIRHF